MDQTRAAPDLLKNASNPVWLNLKSTYALVLWTARQLRRQSASGSGSR
ncbi:hypothetical protein JMJ77_0012596 [Colletotrichum scovillei]|uniref:Uncharacterized protein n=1 Tax=Colletotrichum scovillei TaxID=1209932 RepID=A0A9P7R5Y0_9PEZI|nr:hypothetical protein JMJ77_0012596 [Colletotrichum scovillei]KAG7068874.1 hypothetical protein JMJ76_0002554 [Colletotrichum scovillei]KAG7072830.1 hypothetical protein JMJ78_0013815 [Colletotrichum scovillei]